MRCKEGNTKAWLIAANLWPQCFTIKNHYRRRFLFSEWRKRRQLILFLRAAVLGGWEAIKRTFFCRLIIKLKITSIDDSLENVELVNCPENPKSICSASFVVALVKAPVQPSLKVTRESREQFKYSSSRNWLFIAGAVSKRAHHRADGNKDPRGGKTTHN